MPLNLANAVADLRNNTRTCLRRIPIQIGGQQSGTQTFYASQDQKTNATTRPGKYLKNLNSKAAPDGMLLDQVPGGHQFQANCVGMYNYNAGIQPTIIPNPGAAAHSIILTGQLTDCVFTAFRLPDGSLSCSHTRPIGLGAGGGGALYNLVGNALAGHFRYGPAHDYTQGAHTVSIVGVVKHGEWAFYAQRRERLGNRSVIDVKKIFPN